MPLLLRLGYCRPALPWLLPSPRCCRSRLQQMTRIDTAGLNIQQILEQVQSQAEEMDTMQVGAWPGPPPWLWL